MQIITESEGREINQARALLKLIEKRVRDLRLAQDGHTTFSLGKIAYAVEAAEEGMFQALNMLSSHGDDGIAELFAVYVDGDEYASTSE